MFSITIIPLFLVLATALSVEAKNGTVFIQPRIIGGHDVVEGEVPYQIRLRIPGTFCGGVLISVGGRQAVLTAAHCVPASERPGQITLIAGNIRLGRRSRNEQTRGVTQIIRHSYDPQTFENDIAILVLSRPFKENQFVRPIALPSRNQATFGNVVASGWGQTSQGSISAILQSVTVQVVSQESCQQAYGSSGFRIFSSMLCAAARNRDSCAGDSGGPLRAEDGNYLAGIVSWGIGCAQPNFPGVYVKVSHYVDWIETNIGRL